MPNMYLQMMRQTYPNFKDCFIQTFDDNTKRKDIKLAKVIRQQDYSEEEMNWILERANWKWCGIFFSINSMQWETRNQENVSHINAWACEVDDKSKEDQYKLISVCPIKPSLVIESKKSLHMYWFAKDWTKENRNKICRWLCNFFWWDTAIPKDISRVLRIPWYMHLKDPDDPFEVTIVDWDWEFHTEEEMLSAYSNTTTDADRAEKKRQVDMENQKLKKLLNNDDTWERINSMDAMTMLSEISWTSMVRWETFDFRKNSNWTYQIVINWEAHWSRIDGHWLIWSYDRWGPTRVCWVLRYKIYDAKDIYQWIKENHPEVLPSLDRSTNISKDDSAPADVVDTFSSSINMDNKVPFTRGLPILDEKLWRIDYWKFVAALWESGAGKTTYTFFQALKNAELWYKTCYISLEVSPEELITNKCLRRYWVTNKERDDKTLSPDRKKLINDMYRDLINKPNLHLVQIQNPTLNEVWKFILQEKEKWCRLFYIDNLWILLSDKWNSREYDMVTEASRFFMLLAHSEWITIILLHHFSQGNSISRALPRDLSEIRWGAKLEHDADIIFQVRRNLSVEEWWINKNQTTILIQKHRFWWTTQWVNIRFNKWEYEEIEDWWENPY